MQQYPPLQPQSAPKKRSYAPIIAGLLVFIAVLSVVITVVVVVNRNKDDNNGSSSIIAKETTQLLKMPDLTGMTKEEAISTLSDMNLIAEFKDMESEDQAEGKVFSQVPKSNTEVSSNTNITLYVAKAPSTDAPPVSKKEVVKQPDTPVQESSSAIYYSTARTYVEMHASPSAGSAPLGKIWRGDSVQLIERTSSDWYRVYDGRVTGYVYTDYISNDHSDVPSATDPIYVDDDIDDGFLALRSSASENSSKLAEIPCGASMTYLGTFEDHNYVRSDGYHVRWAKVSYNGKQGYVYDYYINDGDD